MAEVSGETRCKRHDFVDLFEVGLKPGDTVEFFTPKGSRSRGRIVLKAIDEKEDGSKSMRFEPWPIGVRDGDSFEVIHPAEPSPTQREPEESAFSKDWLRDAIQDVKAEPPIPTPDPPVYSEYPATQRAEKQPTEIQKRCMELCGERGYHVPECPIVQMAQREPELGTCGHTTIPHPKDSGCRNWRPATQREPETADEIAERFANGMIDNLRHNVATQREEASRVHSINCIHCPHALQYHLSGVLEGTKRGCTQCDCPGFESQSIAPDSLEAEQRRKHPHYQLIQRLDDFLHELCGDQKYKQEADQLHGEIHEAAFWFVTQQEMSAEEHAQWRMLINQHLVAAREDRDHWKGIAEASRETQPTCIHGIPVGHCPDKPCQRHYGAAPGPSLPTEARVPESRADRLNRYMLNPHDHLLDKSPYGDLVMFTEAAAAIRVLEGKLAEAWAARASLNPGIELEVAQ